MHLVLVMNQHVDTKSIAENNVLADSWLVVYFFLIRYNKQNIQTSRWHQLNLSYL